MFDNILLLKIVYMKMEILNYLMMKIIHLLLHLQVKKNPKKNLYLLSPKKILLMMILIIIIILENRIKMIKLTRKNNKEKKIISMEI